MYLNDKKNNHISSPIVMNILLFIIVIYIIVNMVTCASNKVISIYEVKKGYLSRNNILEGMALRSEKIIRSRNAGHINFFVSQSQRVGVNTIVYSIDNNGEIYEYIKDSKTDPNISELRSLRELNNHFIVNFDSANFDNVDDYKSKIEGYLIDLKSDKALKNLKKLKYKTTLNFNKYKANCAGNIVFYTDGLENIKYSDLKKKYVSKNNYQKHKIRNNDKIKKGDVVYKLLTDEKWQIVASINLENYNELKKLIEDKGDLNKSLNVRVKFLQDGTYTNSKLELDKSENKFFAILSFNDSAVRFLDFRFLSVELQLHQKSGLKIPITALTTKTFYAIPSKYITNGGNSNNLGVIIRSKNKDKKIEDNFVEIEKIDLGDDKKYIDINKLTSDDVIVNADNTSQEYVPNEKIDLKGIYNINKGYTVFNCVNIIDKNDQYYIVDEKSSDLSEYDRIILNSNDISENMVIK